jgi:hypothetical protein
MTKSESEEISNFLAHHGIQSDYYNAGYQAIPYN